MGNGHCKQTYLVPCSACSVCFVLLYSAYYEASILTCSHYFPEVLTFPDSHLKGSMVYLQDIASADLLVEV